MKYAAALFLALLVSALSYDHAAAQFRITENLRHERVFLPPSAPDASRMVVSDHAMIWDHEVPLFISITYDDSRTKREVDYMEVYDLLGNLILVAWTDRFGIYHVAMDALLVTEESTVFERRLVLVTPGTPV
jgi:hypothetical protein